MKCWLLLTAVVCAPVLLAQEFPKGDGRDLTMEKCAGCHGLDQVAAHRDSSDGWDGVIAYMVSRGMVATEDELKIMHKYLFTQFPKEKKNKDKEKSKGKGKSK